MSSFTLEHNNRAQLAHLAHLAHLLSNNDGWLVACLCAEWCDVCRQFRPHFEQWAARHPGKLFLWIDIEDQADFIGDINVDNFPTLLMQRGDIVAFYGVVEPDAHIAERLLMAQVEKEASQLRVDATSSVERKNWQQNYNLRRRLIDATS